jgi:hypothetical protein
MEEKKTKMKLDIKKILPLTFLLLLMIPMLSTVPAVAGTSAWTTMPISGTGFVELNITYMKTIWGWELYSVTDTAGVLQGTIVWNPSRGMGYLFGSWTYVADGVNMSGYFFGKITMIPNNTSYDIKLVAKGRGTFDPNRDSSPNPAYGIVKIMTEPLAGGAPDTGDLPTSLAGPFAFDALVRYYAPLPP